MNLYIKDNVVVLAGKRLHLRLIREFKNPLLNLNHVEMAKVKYGLALAIQQQPDSLELRMKWELLREVENG